MSDLPTRHPTTEVFYNRVNSDLAGYERLVEQLRGEIFDLKLQATAQTADLQILRNAESERDEYAEALLRTEEDLQEQAPRLERAEMRVAILEAEVETVHKQLEEMGLERLQLSLSRQHEGFRIVDHMLYTVQRGRITEGFWRWRSVVLDRGAWRLGLARRCAGVPLHSPGSSGRDDGGETPPYEWIASPTRRSPPSPLAQRALASMSSGVGHWDATHEAGTQTLEGYVDRSLSGQYSELMSEAKEQAKHAARKAARTPNNKEDEALSRRLANSLSPNERPGPIAEEPRPRPPKSRSKCPEDESFGRDIASIQTQVRDVLSSREAKSHRRRNVQPLAELTKLDEKQAILYFVKR